MRERRSYKDSCAYLIQSGLIDPPAPPQPPRLPRHDDEDPPGLSFGRAGLAGANLTDLTLSRTYFGRSLVERTSFENADLSESNLCWNDFIDVNFSNADLSRSDMRASLYEGCSFRGAILDEVDLRHSTLSRCIFDGSSMKRAILTRAQGRQILLSGSQAQDVEWRDDDGEEPPGG